MEVTNKDVQLSYYLDLEILNSLFEAINESFDCDRRTIDSYHSFFSNWLYRVDRDNYTTPYTERGSLVPISKGESFKEKFHSSDYWVGFDLPLFIKADGNIKNIMIVAEDPLRSQSDPNLIPFRSQILLSTPFATHLDWCRRALKEYWDFHSTLLDEGYNVYMTDINKIWIQKDGNSKKERLPNDLIINFRRTLQAEIEMINPEVIVTYGRPAELALKSFSLDSKQKVIHFPHPSKTANGSWKILLSKWNADPNTRCTGENKLRYMLAHASAVLKREIFYLPI